MQKRKFYILVGHIDRRDNMSSIDSKMRNIVGVVILILVASLIIATILPVSITTHNEANTENMSTTTKTLYDLFPIFYVLIPLLAIVGILMWVFKS